MPVGAAVALCVAIHRLQQAHSQAVCMLPVVASGEGVQCNQGKRISEVTDTGTGYRQQP